MAPESTGTFDFSGGHQRQPAAKRQRRKTATEEMEEALKQCDVCGEDCAANSSKCGKHKRALNNMQKASSKGVIKGAKLEEQPQAYQDYVAIFGEGRKGPPGPLPN